MSAQLSRKLTQFYFKRCSMPLSVGQNRYCSETVISKKLAFLEKNTVPVDQDKERPEYITVHGPLDVSCISGQPLDRLKGRLVRIYRTPKNAMQSGTANVDHWELEYDTKERWENPLMGWCSSGDPMSNIKLQFYSKEDAIRYAEKNGLDYFIEAEKKEKPKVKSYAFNFSWNRRHRVSTK